MNIEFVVAEKQYTLSVEEKTGEFFVSTGGKKSKVECRQLSPSVYALGINGRTRLVHIVQDGDKKFVRLEGRVVCLEKPKKDKTRAAADSSMGISSNGIIETPMPGKIVKVNVKENDKIKKGTSLLVVESMKMENAIYAPWDALVKKIHVSEGAQTHLGQPLMEIEKIEE